MAYRIQFAEIRHVHARRIRQHGHGFGASTIMFFGGWSGPLAGPDWLQAALPTVWFALKIFVFIFFYVLLRSTVPRFRYDQLMKFGWKVLLPLSLANILATSFVVGIS